MSKIVFVCYNNKNIQTVYASSALYSKIVSLYTDYDKTDKTKNTFVVKLKPLVFML